MPFIPAPLQVESDEKRREGYSPTPLHAIPERFPKKILELCYLVSILKHPFSIFPFLIQKDAIFFKAKQTGRLTPDLGKRALSGRKLPILLMDQAHQVRAAKKLILKRLNGLSHRDLEKTRSVIPEALQYQVILRRPRKI